MTCRQPAIHLRADLPVWTRLGHQNTGYEFQPLRRSCASRPDGLLDHRFQRRALKNRLRRSSAMTLHAHRSSRARGHPLGVPDVRFKGGIPQREAIRRHKRDGKITSSTGPSLAAAPYVFRRSGEHVSPEGLRPAHRLQFISGKGFQRIRIFADYAATTSTTREGSYPTLAEARDKPSSRG